jgi:hypothetical protein
MKVFGKRTNGIWRASVRLLVGLYLFVGKKTVDSMTKILVGFGWASNFLLRLREKALV